eukprot:gene35156-42581_t
MGERPTPLVTGDEGNSYGEFDLTLEDLSFLISPRNMLSLQVSPSPKSFSTVSTSTSNRKVSPLVTDCEVDEKAQTSLRGYDQQSQPVYSSSQTPNGFNVMTKRKTGKNSVFNFDGFDLPSHPTPPSQNPSISKPSSLADPDDSSSGLAKIHAVDENLSSPEDAPRRFVRIPKRSGGEASTSTTADANTNPASSSSPDHSKSSPPKPAPQLQTSQPPQHTLYGFESMDDSTFKSSIAANISTQSNKQNMISEGHYEELSPAYHPIHNPRKKAFGGDTGVYEQPQQPPRAEANAYPPTDVYASQTYIPNPTLTSYDPNTYYPEPYPSSSHAPLPPLPSINSLGSYTMFSPPPTQLQAGVYGNDPMQNTHASPQPQAHAHTPVNPSLLSYQQLLQDRVSALRQTTSYTPPPPQPTRPQPPSQQTLVQPTPYAYSASGYSYAPSAQSSFTHTPAYMQAGNTPVYEDDVYESLYGDICTLDNLDFDDPSPIVYASTSTYPYPAHMNQASRAVRGKVDGEVEEHGDAWEDGDGRGGGKSVGSGRAGKSLADICKRFVGLYGTENSMAYIAGLRDPNDFTEGTTVLHRVDSAAEALQVHVRRIYELIKILEILSFVTFAGDKRGKFSWRGTKDFLYVLGSIQDEGIHKYPQIAAQHNLSHPPAQRGVGGSMYGSVYGNEYAHPSVSPNKHSGSGSGRGFGSVQSEEHFMVEVICKNFLQLFLVGMNSMSMSSAIQKLIPLEEGQNLADYNKVNATKIRRVYDVTNVLCSLNLLRKKAIPKSKALEAEMHNNIDSPSSSSSLYTDAKSLHGKSSKAAEKADAKVLEWVSFDVNIIRQRYLAQKR